MGSDRLRDGTAGSAVEDSPKRGEIYYVDLEPVKGSEQGGTRPAVVIQNDLSNRFSPVIIVSAISSRPTQRPHATDVWVEPEQTGLTRRSRIMLNQIRTIDKSRLQRYVGRLTDTQVVQVDDAIRISLGLEHPDSASIVRSEDAVS